MLEKSIRHHIQKLHEKKHRRDAGEFLVEGVKGVREVLQSEYQVLVVIVDGKMREDQDIAKCVTFAEQNDVGIMYAGREDIPYIKTTETFPGIMAVVAMPDQDDNDSKMGDVVLALDGVSDPGNLGTIIRTADWFGCKDIILGEGCVDPYNDKVVRSTMGSLFRVSIYEAGNLFSMLKKMKASGYKLYSAELNGTNAHKIKKEGKTIFVLGSESHGVKKEISDISTPVTIPGSGRAESLNVAMAAGILLYNQYQK